MTFKHIVLIAVVLILLILSLFYYVLRDKMLDVSKEEPFVELINKQLTTKKRCVLAKNPGLPIKDSHPYIIEDGSSYRIEDIEIIKEIPLASNFTIQSVELHKGAVSGATICYVFGSITLENETYPFCVSWGRKNAIENSNWVFPQSFWQEKEYDQEFSLPEL
ncbi:hypothetical protein [Aureibaculum marinum]|nr:hypothetical protein [Aureibaculum marinum]